jgi:glyoxylase-like metal-dependent hydrolase (beta-lactamase superfamily II)
MTGVAASSKAGAVSNSVAEDLHAPAFDWCRGRVALETRSPIGDAPGVLSRLPSQLVAFACALACRAGLQDPPVASESPPTPISPPVAAPAADAVAPFASDPAKVCDSCDAWNAPREPFRVFGNTYYVGTAGLSSVLVVGNRGAVLIDGGLSQSAALIAANVRKLGFRLEDIRVIVSSHAHYDHVGGIAALQRASGATVMASPDGKRALEGGQPTDDDPQVGFGPASTGFPAVREVQALSDRQAVRVGDVTLTAHFTPGHTPGGTSWSWRSCEGDNCRDVVSTAGILMRESLDAKWVCGIAWERSLSVQGHNPWHCMHVAVEVGPLRQGASRTIRGRIYLMTGRVEDCWERYRRESFHTPPTGHRSNGAEHVN